MSNYSDTLQRGDTIGCYRIESVLGRGGFAVTYLATDINLDVEVAIKEYMPREITRRDNHLQLSARKEEFAEDFRVGLENFAIEAKTLARFKHPNIVRVHQVLHENNTAYMVMDYEQGQELADILELRETLPEEELRSILLPILDGVEEIHRHGFVHRDIKPSNIYVRHNGTPLLIDFGAARYTMSETTQQLTAVVTVGYTPIEQYNVSEDAQGPWSDIYALAAVCYEAVTGEVPSDSVTRASASVTSSDDPLPSVRAKAKHSYSDDCLDAIDWGLRMEAEDRPQVIDQWRDSFDGIFNPASAYIERKDVSIYSPHRVDSPASKHREQPQEEVVSIPLNTRSDTAAMNAGVVSLNTEDTARHSHMPPVPRDSQMHAPRAPDHRAAETRQQRTTETRSDRRPASTQQQDHRDRPATHNPATHSPETNRPTTHRPELTERMTAPVTTREPTRDINPPRQNTQQPEGRKRSKLERPRHLPTEEQMPTKPTLAASMREEIEFDDTDWNYEPPKRSSPWKLLVPALGLAAIVGGSLLYVNSPDKFKNLLKRSPTFTTAEALDVAQQKVIANEAVFPAGDSAIDYYNLVLASNPDNPTATAAVASIETSVRKQIADLMRNGDTSAANRLLARADEAGLDGVYNRPEPAPTSQPVISDNVPLVPATQETLVTPVDTAAISAQSPDAQPSNQTQPTALISNEPADINTGSRNTSGIDNTISPFIQNKITEVEELVKQGRFDEARIVYEDADRFIPDQSISRRLRQQIESGEAAARAAQAAPEPAAPVSVPTESTQLASLPAQTEQNSADQTPPQITPAGPPRRSFVAASGPSADHLNELRLAIEGKNMQRVSGLSQQLSAGRRDFLTRMFQRYERLDVTIDDVNQDGNDLTARLSVSMYNRNEEGTFYSAGRWNGVRITSARENGEWQRINW